MAERGDREHAKEAIPIDDGKRLFSGMQEPRGGMGFALVSVECLYGSRELADGPAAHGPSPFVERRGIVLDERGVVEHSEVAWKNRSEHVHLRENPDEPPALVQNGESRYLCVKEPSGRLGERRHLVNRCVDEWKVAQVHQSWKSNRYPVAIRSETIVTGNPTTRNRTNEIG